jgi:CDP-2,3-bis-(O-geranylgeranyl)-sn-glycerol synthase
MLSFCWHCIFKGLLLLIAANGSPVLIRKVLGTRPLKPIDNGYNLSDGYRLFGNTKTWPGLLSALFFTTVIAFIFGINLLTGFFFAMLTMTGDILTSFIKRRLGKQDSSRARGLDTLPESLLPLWLLSDALGLNLIDIAITAGLFFLCEEFISPILYKIHIRNQPY